MGITIGQSYVTDQESGHEPVAATWPQGVEVTVGADGVEVAVDEGAAEGAAEVPAAEDAPEGGEAADPAAVVPDGLYDPAEHGVGDVNKYLAKAEDAERERVLAAERAGKARKGILEA